MMRKQSRTSLRALVHIAGFATAVYQTKVNVLSQWYHTVLYQVSQENLMKIVTVSSVKLQ